MKKIIPGEVSTADLHQYLLGAVSPRPIAFASTIDENGIANIAPYSFFNCFSSNPPIVVFSSNRRVSNNTTKDTLTNIEKNKEVVINVVNHAIVRQMAIASVDFPSEESEFNKSGLTKIKSELVAPYRIAESPAHLECKVQEIIPLGDKGGAGHLIICKVVMMHVAESVLDEDGKINPHKIDLMGRMGRAFYVRASGQAVMPIFQSVTEIVIGYDALPEAIRNSKILTGNNLGQLAGLKTWPTMKQADAFLQQKETIKEKLAKCENQNQVFDLAKSLLDEDDQREAAANVLVSGL